MICNRNQISRMQLECDGESMLESDDWNLKTQNNSNEHIDKIYEINKNENQSKIPDGCVTIAKIFPFNEGFEPFNGSP